MKRNTKITGITVQILCVSIQYWKNLLQLAINKTAFRAIRYTKKKCQNNYSEAYQLLNDCNKLIAYKLLSNK